MSATGVRRASGALRVLLGALVWLVVAVPGALADSISTTVTPRADCTIYSGAPSSSATCGGGGDDLVGSDGNGSLYRTMIAFPGGLGLPAGAKVLSSTLTINVAGAFGSTPTWMFAMTQPFTPGAATWNTYDGVHGWSTPGGDFNDTLQASATVTAAGSVSFPVTAMTQSWLDGSDPVPALMLLGYAPAGNAYSFANLASGHGPYLSLVYQPQATSGPVVTTPVSTPLPRPKARRSLKVRLVLAWTWNRSTIRLEKVAIGSFPHDMRLTIACQGRACPRHTNASAAGPRGIHHLLRALQGTRFHAGQRLLVTLRAHGYRPERARIILRSGKLPLVRQL